MLTLEVATFRNYVSQHPPLLRQSVRQNGSGETHSRCASETRTRTNTTQLIPALLALVSAISVSAAPLPAEAEAAGQVEARACAFTCGSVCYTSSDIQAALNKGYSLQQSGDDISSVLPSFQPLMPAK
jgi:hypothetical protein